MRKYLNTPEEVIKALKEGKEVMNTCWTYKLVDGFILYTSVEDNTKWAICSTIGCGEKLYIEEAEPLKFEVGKFYKSRNGNKSLCAFIGSEKLCYPVKLVSQVNGNEFLVTLEGKYNKTNKISQNDIIGEWED